MEKFQLNDVKQVKIFGRTDFVRGRLELRNSACGFELRVKGGTVFCFFEADNVNNFFKVYIDEKEERKFKVKDDLTVVLADFSDNEEHIIRVVKITRPAFGTVYVREITIENGKILTPEYYKQLRIEVYGDSLTCGYGLLGDNKNDDAPEYEDATMSYAYLAAQRLNAQIYLVAQSGWAVGASRWRVEWSDRSLPAIYDRISDENFKRWDFSKFGAELVIVNLGTNDKLNYPSDNHERDEEEFRKNYAEFLGKLRKKYPNAFILCLNGLLDTMLEPIISDVVFGMKDYLIFQLTLPFGNSGAGGHPDAEEHRRASEVLYDYIKKILDDFDFRLV